MLFLNLSLQERDNFFQKLWVLLDYQVKVNKCETNLYMALGGSHIRECLLNLLHKLGIYVNYNFSNFFNGQIYAQIRENFTQHLLQMATGNLPNSSYVTADSLV